MISPINILAGEHQVWSSARSSHPGLSRFSQKQYQLNHQNYHNKNQPVHQNYHHMNQLDQQKYHQSQNLWSTPSHCHVNHHCRPKHGHHDYHHQFFITNHHYKTILISISVILVNNFFCQRTDRLQPVATFLGIPFAAPPVGENHNSHLPAY